MQAVYEDMQGFARPAPSFTGRRHAGDSRLELLAEESYYLFTFTIISITRLTIVISTISIIT